MTILNTEVTFMTTPATISWVPPTLNTDGSALDPGEVTGYEVGIRAAAGTAGVYPTIIPVAGADTTSLAVASIVPPLPAGDYFTAVRAAGPVDSDFTAELPFTVDAKKPNPPSGFTVG